MQRPKRDGIQLAYPVDDGKVKRLGQIFLVQPKLNGERCKVVWFQEEPVLLSSYGNKMPWLGQIIEDLLELKARTGTEFSLDGEIYKHGWPREKIDSAIRTRNEYNPDNGELEYHVFDIIDNRKQLDRIVHAGQIIKDLCATKFVYSAVTTQVTWQEYARMFTDQGYEGIILRHLDALYVPKRTVSMLKFKPSEKDAYKIIDVLEAVSEEGDPKGMIGAFYVTDGTGTQFKVGAGKILHSKRIELWNNRESLIGRDLVVKHEKIKTSGGIPVCTVAVEVL